MLIATGREERVFIRPTLKPEWKLKLLTMFQHADETGVFEIPEGEDYDDISIQFKLGERTRTMRLRNIERLSIVEEIPETLVRERSADKIRNYMISTADNTFESDYLSCVLLCFFHYHAKPFACC